MKYSTTAALLYGALLCSVIPETRAHDPKALNAKPPLTQDHNHRRLDEVGLDGGSVLDYLDQQNAAGVDHPHFTLIALRQDQQPVDGSGRALSEGEPYRIDVIVANASVGPDTLVDDGNGNVLPASDYGISSTTLLVAEDNGKGDFAMLAVSREPGREGLQGMAKRAGEDLVRVEQLPGEPATVKAQEAFVPPADWTCGVGEDDGDPDASAVEPDEASRRGLFQEAEDLFGTVHGHDHHGNDGHYHHPGHDHHDHDQDMLSQLRTELKQNKVNLRKVSSSRRALYPTDNFPKLYSYEVDIRIEIDDAVINTNTNLAGAVAYVNALVSAVNVVYEREVDTHLRVKEIIRTARYEGANGATTNIALNTMKTAHSRLTPSDVDLHHALLGRAGVTGGLATLGAVCNAQDGFGVSAGVQGNMLSLDGSMYWDINVFAHEVGHNFGARHTHDNLRVPKVDNCPVSCPTGTSVSGSATIMSYCHLCAVGGLNSIGLTFGGHWDKDDRRNIANWVNNPTIGDFNVDAKRVPKGMYDHISALGSCVNSPQSPVPEVSCTTDTDCHDGISCTVDTCNDDTNQCINTLKNNCCGNFICEANEPGTCSDCGPFVLSSPPSNSISRSGGIMFNVEAKNAVAIDGLTLYFSDRGACSVDLYTAPRTFVGIELDPSQWSRIIDDLVLSVYDAPFPISFPSDVVVSAGSIQSFYLAPSCQLSLHNERRTTVTPTLAEDDNLKILNPARGPRAPSQFSSEAFPDPPWSMKGKVNYKKTLSNPSPSSSPTTPFPTTSPTTSPTSTPSKSPTKGPSSSPTSPVPTKTPSTIPTSTPSKSPSKSPSSSPTSPVPTRSPSKKPTSSPSKSPTMKPTTSPTTISPSTSPSKKTTPSPTAPAPSSSPTKAPTPLPTKSPTKKPSMSPTIPPPTTSPTMPPPSASPTTLPPSLRPTKQPTIKPTNNPGVPMRCPCRCRCRQSGMLLQQMIEEFIRNWIAAIERMIQQFFASVQSSRCRVLRINGQKVSGRMRGRRLLSLNRKLQDSEIDVEYELDLVAVCSGSECSDAESVKEISNSVYNQVTAKLDKAITDGSLIQEIRDSSSAEIAGVLENATATGEFSPAVVPLLDLLSDWYPDWQGQTRTCKNDGNSPMYFNILGTYFEKSLDACCTRFYSWEYYSCMGGAGTLPTGYYPNWGETEIKCLNATETFATMPDHFRQSPDQWLFDDIESCCKNYYSWDFNQCLVGSGVSLSTYATFKWFVNHKKEICQQDCPESAMNATCGGLAMEWNQLYETADSCCGETLSWVQLSSCQGQSSQTTVAGSYQWFVNHPLEKCVKDCEYSSDLGCGGLAKKWDQLYSSSSECCDRIWWIERDECTLG